MAMAAPAAADAVAERLAAKKAAQAATKQAATKEAAAGAAAGAGGGQGGGGAKAQSSASRTPSGKGSGSKKGSGPRAVSWAWSGSRRLLMAQFLLCIVVLALGMLTADPEEGKSVAPRAMVKGSAFALIFFLLALLSAGGGSSARASTAVGTLITVAYTMTSSDVHTVVTWIGKTFKGAGDKYPATEEDSGAEKGGPP